MCLFKNYGLLFLLTLVTCAWTQDESQFLNPQVQPSHSSFLSDANDLVSDQSYIKPTPSAFLPGIAVTVKPYSSDVKPLMIVTATRIGMSQYVHPSATVTLLEPSSTGTAPLPVPPQPDFSPEQEDTTKAPEYVSQSVVEPVDVVDDVEDETDFDDVDGDADEDNEIAEPLPNPVALISPNGEGNNPPLEEEFAEAFKKVGPNGRRRRLKPGARKRVRMRVKKVNGTITLNNGDPNYLNEPETPPEPEPPRYNKRFRSTTTKATTPSPDVFANSLDDSLNTLGSTPYIMSTSVVVSGPKPIILKDVNDEIAVAEPQIEKPASRNSNESSTGEWLQSEHSTKHQNLHDHGHYMEERDNWEKNYMNLQQNSFYGSTEDANPRDTSDPVADSPAVQQESIESRPFFEGTNSRPFALPSTVTPSVVNENNGQTEQSSQPRPEYYQQSPFTSVEQPPAFDPTRVFSPPGTHYDRTKEHLNIHPDPIFKPSFNDEAYQTSASIPGSQNVASPPGINRPGFNSDEYQSPETPFTAESNNIGPIESRFPPKHGPPHKFKGSPLDPVIGSPFPIRGPPPFPFMHSSPPPGFNFNPDMMKPPLPVPGPTGPVFGAKPEGTPTPSPLSQGPPEFPPPFRATPGPRGPPRGFPGPRFLRPTYPGRAPKLVVDENGASDDSAKQGDYSKAQSFQASPQITFPTPPPVPNPSKQVTPHRHYPPHTHSMSERPDYEPANPPLPNGHPMQSPYDQFPQNEFKDEFKETQNSENNQLSDFQTTGATQDSFSAADVRSPPPIISVDPEPTSPRPYFDFGPPYFNKIRDDSREHGYPRPNHFSHEHEEFGGGFSSSPRPIPPKNYYREKPEDDIVHQSLDSQSNDNKEEKGKPTPNTFSDVPYVLMFPQLIPEEAMRPAPPKLMTKEIPVVQASTAQGYTPDGKPVLTAGFTAVPVHPRHQMYQVLATAHYEKMMDKYMESKKKPPAAIYTPYGVLVPMGPAEGGRGPTAPDRDVYAGSYSHQSRNKIHHPPVHHSPPKPLHQEEKQLLNLLLGGRIPALGHLHYHKKAHIKNGRLSKQVNFKANIEPAIDLLAEKLAIKMAALEHLIPGGRPQHGSYGSHSNSHHSIINPESSYSEVQFVKAEFEPVKNSTEAQQKLKELPNEPSHDNSPFIPIEDKRFSSPSEFKSYLKGVLKERLQEVLEEVQKEDEFVRQGPAPAWPKPRLPFSSGRPNKQHMVPIPSNIAPSQATPPNGGRWNTSGPPPGPHPVGGLISTLRRLFSFAPFGHSREQYPTHISNGTLIQFRPLPTVMHPANKRKDKLRKKPTKELEKWLDLLKPNKGSKGDEPSSKRSMKSGTRKPDQQPSGPNPSIKVVSPGPAGKPKMVTPTTEKLSRRTGEIEPTQMSPIKPNTWKPMFSAFFGPATRSVLSIASGTPTVLHPRTSAVDSPSVAETNKHS